MRRLLADRHSVTKLVGHLIRRDDVLDLAQVQLLQRLQHVDVGVVQGDPVGLGHRRQLGLLLLDEARAVVHQRRGRHQLRPHLQLVRLGAVLQHRQEVGAVGTRPFELLPRIPQITLDQGQRPLLVQLAKRLVEIVEVSAGVVAADHAAHVHTVLVVEGPQADGARLVVEHDHVVQ